MFEVVATIAVVLAVITLVGHFIWVGLAALFRVLSGGPKRTGQEVHRCAYCNLLTPIAEPRCQWCGRLHTSAEAGEVADLAAVRRQLRRWREARAMDAAMLDKLLDRVQRDEQRVTGRPAPAPAARDGGEVGRPPVPVAKVIQSPPGRAPAGPVRQPVKPAAAPKRAPAPDRPAPEVAPPAPPPVTGPPPVPAAPSTRPAPKPAPVPKPAPPRKSWLETLTSFMEERNIRWAELVIVLVAGLLIVGPSVPLTISLWQTLEQIPYLKFFVFIGYSSVVFAAGLYAHHRWKLDYTGRGLLVIAALLVPLNFLGMASLSQDAWNAFAVGSEILALGIFAGLVAMAAAVLVPDGRRWQVLGVVGGGASVLLAAHLGPAVAWPSVLLAILPVAIFGLAIGGYAVRSLPGGGLEARQVHGLFIHLGTSTFAMAIPFGLVLARSVPVRGLGETLVWASLPLAPVALPVLAAGLAVLRGTAREASTAAYRTTATAILLIGTGVLVAAVGMAWPQPLLLLLVGLFATVSLLVVAFGYRVPAAHGGAIAAAVLALLAAYHAGLGHVPWLSRDFSTAQAVRWGLGPSSGVLLVCFCAVLAVVADLLGRRGRRADAGMYVGGACGVAAANLLLVAFHGLFGDGSHRGLALAVFTAYGLGGLVVAARLRRPAFSYVGLALVVGSTLWALGWYEPDHVGPAWASGLALHALIYVIAALLLGRVAAGVGEGAAVPSPADRPGVAELYRWPLIHVAQGVAPLALALGVLTAWYDRAAIHHVPAPVITAGVAAACYFLLAWVLRSAAHTWVGSAVVMAGLYHTLVYNYTGWLAQPRLDSLLAHATLAVLAGMGLDGAVRHPAWRRWADALRRVFSIPLGHTALITSALALPAVVVSSWEHKFTLALCLVWLATIWAVIAWDNRWPHLFAGCQAVMTLAAVVGTTAWLERYGWNAARPVDLRDPRCWQVYGVALAGLGLAWTVARILLRRSRVGRQLLEPPWRGIDVVVAHGVVAAQLGVLVVCLLPACWAEWGGGPGGPSVARLAEQAVGPAGWLLAGVLATLWLVAMWHRWRVADLASMLVVAFSVPWLVAGRFAGQAATASALRWGLGVALLAGVAGVWQRSRLAGWLRGRGAVLELGGGGPRAGRGVVVAAAAVPVVLLTFWAAGFHLSGVSPGGPGAETLFARIGARASCVIPLVLVTAGLVALALREASAGYAFAAGLIVQMAVTLGYLTGRAAPGWRELVVVLQWASITAAVWAIVWLVARRRVQVWREEGVGRRTPAILMNVQLGLGAAGIGFLLVPAVVALVFCPPAWQGWAVAVGSWASWVAVVLVGGAAGYRQIQVGRPVPPGAVGWAGMGVLALLAVTVRAVVPESPEWGYRTLMLGWAAFSLFVALATWWVAEQRTLPGALGPPQALIRMASVWVTAAGGAAVLLGVKAAWWHSWAEDRLWAAAATAVASGASAAMAVWRRREGWAFAAGLGVNGAASLVVWYLASRWDWASWGLVLIQANVIASGAVALVWLAARRRLYALRELTVRESPLLGLQTSLGVAGMIVLLVPAVIRIAREPSAVPAWTSRLVEPQGGIALLLAAAAAGWYLRQVYPRGMAHAAAGLLLGVSVLAGCWAEKLAGSVPHGGWIAYHVLTASWSAASLLMVVLGWLGSGWRVTRQADPARPETRAVAILPPDLVRGWATAMGAAALLLAVVWSYVDPAGPWWSAGSVLALAAAAGLLALWQGARGHVYTSGILFNVAATVVWMHRGPLHVAAFIHTQVLALALGSALWTLMELAGWAQRRLAEEEGGVPPFSHAAVVTGMALLGSLAGVSFLLGLVGEGHPAVGRLGWFALAAMVLSSGLCLWDVRARFPLAALYGAGLMAVLFGLDVRGYRAEVLCWHACPELALALLLAAVLRRTLPHFGWLVRALRIPDRASWGDRAWFDSAQGAMVGLLALAGLWISIDPVFDGLGRAGMAGWPGRLMGPLGGLLLLGTALTMAGAGGVRGAWRDATFGLVPVVLAEAGWAWLPAELALPWLHRLVVLLVASVVATAVAGLGVPAVAARATDWGDRARRWVRVYGGVAVASLATILVSELSCFQRPDGVPMALAGVVVVAAALAVLVVAAVVFAVVPRWDPLELSDRGRQAYVYAAEALAAVVGLHLWLTMPWLFRLGIMERYWMLIVLGVAFGGAALSELFHRRGMPVLSQPLERTAAFLPLAPAVGFFFVPTDVETSLWLAGKSPALWFLGSLFYGFLGVTRRSRLYGLLSIIAAVVGCWTLWHFQRWGFVDHLQLWLIPAGLALLVAEYLNRDQLDETKSAVFRYVALSLVYVSSTADYLRNLGHSLWLPLILIGLSVLGVLVGVVLRIRSFLVVGVTFLLLVMVTMVKYAAVDLDQTWVLWVFCIALGAALIFAFAVFERRRADILAAVRRFREWER